MSKFNTRANTNKEALLDAFSVEGHSTEPVTDGESDFLKNVKKTRVSKIDSDDMTGSITTLTSSSSAVLVSASSPVSTISSISSAHDDYLRRIRELEDEYEERMDEINPFIEYEGKTYKNEVYEVLREALQNLEELEDMLK